MAAGGKRAGPRGCCHSTRVDAVLAGAAHGKILEKVLRKILLSCRTRNGNGSALWIQADGAGLVCMSSVNAVSQRMAAMMRPALSWRVPESGMKKQTAMSRIASAPVQ